MSSITGRPHSTMRDSASHSLTENHPSRESLDPVGVTTGQDSTPSWLLEGQPARICFLVAFIAFTAAGASWVITSFLSGWMEVAGMLAVGLFYLGLGLLEVGRRSTIDGGP